MVKKLISMSLYGSDLMYLNGAIANAKLLPKIFPGWTLRIYCCDEALDISPLEKLDCEIRIKSRSKLHSGMFWRFFSAWDEEAERVIFRDADSRFNIREAAAVKAWEKSGLDAHCMKDHPHHAQLPISGGMWGIKTGVLPRELFQEIARLCRVEQKRISDMRWLRDKVHPLIEHSLLRHSSVETKWPNVPFPPHSLMEGFVGQQYDEEGEPIWPGKK